MNEKKNQTYYNTNTSIWYLLLDSLGSHCADGAGAGVGNISAGAGAGVGNIGTGLGNISAGAGADFSSRAVRSDIRFFLSDLRYENNGIMVSIDV
jgi:hypothetical protein